MPIYEYECSKCNTSFSKLQKVSDKVICPTCGNKQPERVVSIPSPAIWKCDTGTL
jgi:putative FmdB family regulatory protein